MSQSSDLIIEEQSGRSARQEINVINRALASHHKGDIAPVYAVPGMMWVDDSGAPWVLKLFDGTAWIVIGLLDAASHQFTPYYDGGALQLATDQRAGLSKRATQQAVETGENNTDFITPQMLAAAFNAQPAGNAPVGALMMYAAETPPLGWLVRDGSAISRDEYANLFAVIGTLYGEGDGSTTFNLPDDQGLFERGWDAGGARDPNRDFGSYQGDQFKSHTHSLPRGANYAGSPKYDLLTLTEDRVQAGSHTTTATGGVETRPKNRAYLPIIKY